MRCRKHPQDLLRAKHGESNLLAHIVIASEAKQSPNWHGDCFVAALLAMTSTIVSLRAKHGGAKRVESNLSVSYTTVQSSLLKIWEEQSPGHSQDRLESLFYSTVKLVEYGKSNLLYIIATCLLSAVCGPLSAAGDCFAAHRGS